MMLLSADAFGLDGGSGLWEEEEVMVMLMAMLVCVCALCFSLPLAQHKQKTAACFWYRLPFLSALQQ